MRRVAIRTAYDGTDFVGWQRQPNGRSVQGTLEEIFGRIARNRPVSVVGAGRTDSGVHASGQVAHVDLPLDLDADDLRYRLNRMLPGDIAVSDVVVVPRDFHARYRACLRRYRYTIVRQANPFRTRFAWHVDADLDLVLLREATAAVLGRRDFTSLSKINPDTSNPVCHVSLAEWHVSDTMVTFDIHADRFLYGMVRLTVGLLTDIALHRRPVADVRRVLECTDRSHQSSMAPARGLELVGVDYPDSPFH